MVSLSNHGEPSFDGLRMSGENRQANDFASVQDDCKTRLDPIGGVVLLCNPIGSRQVPEQRRICGEDYGVLTLDLNLVG